LASTNVDGAGFDVAKEDPTALPERGGHYPISRVTVPEFKATSSLACLSIRADLLEEVAYFEVLRLKVSRRHGNISSTSIQNPRSGYLTGRACKIPR
jgi:hypothetical protein